MGTGKGGKWAGDEMQMNFIHSKNHMAIKCDIFRDKEAVAHHSYSGSISTK